MSTNRQTHKHSQALMNIMCLFARLFESMFETLVLKVQQCQILLYSKSQGISVSCDLRGTVLNISGSAINSLGGLGFSIIDISYMTFLSIT